MNIMSAQTDAVQKNFNFDCEPAEEKFNFHTPITEREQRRSVKLQDLLEKFALSTIM